MEVAWMKIQIEVLEASTKLLTLHVMTISNPLLLVARVV